MDEGVGSPPSRSRPTAWSRHRRHHHGQDVSRKISPALRESPAHYGTVDGERLVERWLERMHSSPAHLLRGSHPHAGRANGEIDEGREKHQNRQFLNPKGVKRTRSPPASSPRGAGSLDRQETPISTSFTKRPRYKTKPDKYEIKHTSRQDRPKLEKLSRPKRRTDKSTKNRLLSGKGVVENFASDAILNDRLTVRSVEHVLASIN